MKRILGLAAVLVAVAVVAWDVSLFMNRSLPVGESTILEVEPGMGFQGVTSALADQGAFDAPRHARYFVWYARARGVTGRIQAGEYRVQPDMTPRTLLSALVQGHTRRHRLTVVEGWTFRRMRREIEAHEAVDATLAGEDAATIMRAIGESGQHPEGRFLPETYHFPRGVTDVALYRRAYEAMTQVLQTAWENRANDLPLDSPYEALILASIVEKETAVPTERRRIAGVFVRRLRKGMRLQTDPAVIYGVNDFDGNLRRRHLREDTPYNTYTRPGLPPTPIALPGRASIEAALHPTDGDALYFVSKGDGTHVFSDNLEEHNRAVRKYQLQK